MKPSSRPGFWLAVLGWAALSGCVRDEPAGAGAAAGGTAGTAGVGTGGSGGSGAGDCTPLEPIPTRLWRLSTTQFSNSVRDLLGMTSGPAVNDTGGSSEYAFFSDTAVGVDDTLAFSLYQAVQAALEEVRPRIAELAPCTEGQSEDLCAENFVQTFGARAFRRPLDATELTELLRVYAEGRKQTFGMGIESVIEALLQSPSFLYRSELGTSGESETVLTPYETATQLAYLLLDSTPDAELIAAAGDGRLSTPEGIAAQIDRLLATDGVRSNVNRIVLDWFGVRQVLSKTTKSAVLLASLPEAERNQAELTHELLTATRLFVDELLWQGSKRVDDLVLSRRMFVNRRLATLYGLPFSGPPAQFIGAEFPEAEQRAGILTQPGLLWAVSDPEVTSIVHRGLYVHNDILCLDPVPSPGDLLEQPDIKAALAMLSTEREKSNYRMNTELCAGCHSEIDPFSLILENFDPIGAYRTMADGIPVDPTADFTLSPSLMGPVTGAAAFAQGIVNDGLFTACATQKIASYAIGRSIRARATCEVRDAHARLSAADGTIQSLFREVAVASFVRTRRGGVE